jgi:DNA-binding GntR family transcriptional regulator
MNTAADGPLYTRSASTGEVAYSEIKSWILRGAVPVGARLREERIAERLAVSRTPVREALLRLYGERFLERNGDGGYRIAHLTLRSIRELYGMRMALETYALRETVALADPEAMPALRVLSAEWEALVPEAPDTDPDFVLVDEDFHRRLAVAGGNRMLAGELRSIGERIRPVRSHDFVVPGRIGTTVAQHLAILEAVLSSSASAASLLEQHILESQAVVEAALGRAMERMLTAGEEALAW